MTTPTNACRVCGAIGAHRIFVGREMMFGTREQFPYFQCSECSCLQIGILPSDLARHYPPTYYSHQHPNTNVRGGLISRVLQRQRVRNALFGKGHKLNKLLTPFVRLPTNELLDGVLRVVDVLRIANIRSFRARFLDIGCGSYSQWLATLSRMGFTRLEGVDPFILADIRVDGMVIRKVELGDVSGRYSLVTMHHSLEHMPDQVRALSFARRLLDKDGICLVRVPIVSSFAWRQYGTNWVEMDPPRHFYLHSKKSIELAAQKAGLTLTRVVGDSLDFEFYASEQYRRGIALTDPQSLWMNRSSSVFSPEEREAFRQLAHRVNETGEFGRACFFFRES